MQLQAVGRPVKRPAPDHFVAVLVDVVLGHAVGFGEEADDDRGGEGAQRR